MSETQLVGNQIDIFQTESEGVTQGLIFEGEKRIIDPEGADFEIGGCCCSLRSGSWSLFCRPPDGIFGSFWEQVAHGISVFTEFETGFDTVDSDRVKMKNSFSGVDRFHIDINAIGSQDFFVTGVCKWQVVYTQIATNH